MTVEEVMEEILQDRAYYRNSGGGVTLSGGEVSTQPEFALELLQALKKEGISTAIADPDVRNFSFTVVDAGSSGGAVPRERMQPPAEKQAIFSACFLRNLTFVNG